MRPALPNSALGEDEDEQRREGQVDEVHAFDQTDDQEHGRVEAALDLGLAGDAGDGLATGQAVTDGGADGPASERQAAADEGAGQLDGLLGGCSAMSGFSYLGCSEVVIGTG